MLALKRKEGLESYTELKRQTMMVSCFLCIKLLVAKVLFKPYKITHNFGKSIDFVKDKEVFKENCVSMGYTLIAILTDFLFGLFGDEFTAKGADLKKPAVVKSIKAKIYSDLMPISQQTTHIGYDVFAEVASSEEWANLLRLLDLTFKSTLIAIDRHSKQSRVAWDDYKGKVRLQRLEADHNEKKKQI
jgi:hypothetical protein